MSLESIFGGSRLPWRLRSGEEMMANMQSLLDVEKIASHCFQSVIGNFFTFFLIDASRRFFVPTKLTSYTWSYASKPIDIIAAE